MNDIHAILEKYWKFKAFRPLQEDIIRSVLEGNDTLALLPTGGGKSICFQVPALAKEGICIVVSPLIALMKDQVENLVRKGIKAVAITSTMHRREIDIALDNCVHGDIRFLYLSPERLETEIVRVRLQKMNVNLIAIDESHCISQWGYDFRPSYLRIELLRELLPGIPVLALTATATPEVVNDIQKKLRFKKQNVFRKSFERKNISYVVRHAEDKLAMLIRIANSVQGTGIVYVRNRKKTHEIASYLKSHSISADFYHAGLDPKTRDQKQSSWINNQTRVIVCTNAFGMGIDKPDVRFVVHLDLPDSLEAYFQEAGRAGRDEQKAFAILLYNPGDNLTLKKNTEMAFPELETIRSTYQAMVNFFQMPAGSGEGVTLGFDISAFCDNYKLNAITVFNSLKFIEREGYITLSDAVLQPSRIKFELSREDLYKFQITNPALDPLIKLMLRTYSGVFDNFVKISESDLAGKSKMNSDEIVKKLQFLHQQGIITYAAQTELPQITFLRPRVDTRHLSFSADNYATLKKRAFERMETVIHYAESTHRCRSQLLLAYFGDTESLPCEHCDVCLQEKKGTLHTDEFEAITQQVKELLAVHPLSLKALTDSVSGFSEDKVLQSIQWLADIGHIKKDHQEKWFLA